MDKDKQCVMDDGTNDFVNTLIYLQEVLLKMFSRQLDGYTGVINTQVIGQVVKALR